MGKISYPVKMTTRSTKANAYRVRFKGFHAFLEAMMYLSASLIQLIIWFSSAGKQDRYVMKYRKPLKACFERNTTQMHLIPVSITQFLMQLRS